MTLAKRVLKLRLERKLTQQQAADKVGFKQQSWQNIENGRIKSPRLIKKIADVLGVTPEFLLFGVSNSPASSYDKVTLLKFIDIIEFLYGNSDNVSVQKISINLNGVDIVNTLAFVITENIASINFKIGDMVIVDKLRKPKDGDFVIATKDKKCLCFRRYVKDSKGEHLFPLNDKEESMKVDSSVKIEGVAIQKQSVTELV